MKHLFPFLLLLFSILPLSSQQVEPNWESINRRGYPQWFSDAKLGIFIHWGLYSVPAYAGTEGYGEWYYRGLMVGDTGRINFQNRTYGNNWQYRDFTKLFKAELWNPDEWAALFEQSGAKYVLLVSKHHDGYCLWNSRYQPEWNSVTTGPGRDIVGELSEAVRRHNMKMGLYYSLTEWTNPRHIWMVDPDDSIADYVDNYMIPQYKELITQYRPSVLFTDGEWNNRASDFHAEELIAWYYNTVGAEAIVNDRWGGGTQHGFRTPEYSAGITLTDRPWAECRGLGRSFALNRREPLNNYLTSDELIRHFVKLVAAGGGMTLNVGPAADGQIPLLQQERLRDLGNWLKINGEAIYGTHPHSHFYEYKTIEIQRIDSLIDFNWVRNSPDKQISYDHFDAEWNGIIRPTTSEKFTFEVEVDDDVCVIIDNDTIINYHKFSPTGTASNAQTAQNSNQTSAEKKLKAGQDYSVKVIYHENDLEAKIRLQWSSKSVAKSAVPAAGGWQARYRCQQPYICYTTRDNHLYATALEYPQDELRLHYTEEPEKGTKIQLLGCEKELPWHYENGELIIDTTPLKYNDLKSTSAWVFRIDY